MSDILTDQKIHLIVRDYKRMYEQHDKLVAIGKEFQNKLIAKEKELAKVKMELNDIKAKAKGVPKDKPKKAIRCQLSEIESRATSAYNNADKLMNALNGIILNIKEIKQLLKED